MKYIAISDPHILDDIKYMKRLRQHYRRHFKDGESDRAFLAWVETLHIDKPQSAIDNRQSAIQGVPQ